MATTRKREALSYERNLEPSENVVMVAAHLSHHWMPRYTARLVKLLPHLTPHQAVGYALSAFPESAALEPETAAEMFVSAKGRSAQSNASRGLRERFNRR